MGKHYFAGSLQGLGKARPIGGKGVRAMMSIAQIKSFYPPSMQENAGFLKHILKEYLQLLILEFLSATRYVRSVALIGGTNMRLVRGIDRFSEDLDFDCKNFSEEDFTEMTEDVLRFLTRNGFRVELKLNNNRKLSAFRSNLVFPEFLFDQGLTGHREERFLLKLEAEDQQYLYKPNLELIKGCGFFFSFPVPPDAVLCSMKISALLDRSKGRDFYDVMVLLSQTKPDYSFLGRRYGIHDLMGLKKAFEEKLKEVELIRKRKDFEHLLFSRENSRRILHFEQFVRSL
jgi:predicted nucleotidyltransferase component of viral defense system